MADSDTTTVHHLFDSRISVCSFAFFMVRFLRLSKKKERGNTEVYRTSWAYLLRRAFGAEGFECPRCCGVMELRMGQVFGAMAQRLFLSLSGKGRAPPME